MAAGGVESSGHKGCSLAAVPGDELAHSRHQLGGNLHDRLGLVFEGSFILRHRLNLGLLFIVSKNPPDSLFVPSWGKVHPYHGRRIPLVVVVRGNVLQRKLMVEQIRTSWTPS